MSANAWLSAPEETAIGGYFQLELPRGHGEFHRDALRFQSSRAAFLALLLSQRPRAVWVPWYLCDSMIEPLRMAGTVVKRYEIDRDMSVRSADLAHDEWLLYVNYFGLCDSQVTDVLQRFPRERVVIDNAQAFFAPPQDCLATLYSPRKFVGVPDGGYLVTRADVALPEEVDTGSLERSAHLLRRLAVDAENGYADYAAAEESLKLQTPRRMSALTQRILASIDYDAVQAQRMANFDALHARLGRYNRFTLPRGEHAVPLCYPLANAPTGLRAALQPSASTHRATGRRWPIRMAWPRCPSSSARCPPPRCSYRAISESAANRSNGSHTVFWERLA